MRQDGNALRLEGGDPAGAGRPLVFMPSRSQPTKRDGKEGEIYVRSGENR